MVLRIHLNALLRIPSCCEVLARTLSMCGKDTGMGPYPSSLCAPIRNGFWHSLHDSLHGLLHGFLHGLHGLNGPHGFLHGKPAIFSKILRFLALRTS